MIKQLNIQQESLDTFSFSSDFVIPNKKESGTIYAQNAKQSFEKIWNDLKSLLNMLYKRGPEIEICYQELCDDLKNIGLYKLEEELFEELNNYYKMFLLNELDQLKSVSPADLLNKVEELWLKLADNMGLVTQILIWFERGFLLKKKMKTKTMERLIVIVLHDSLSNLVDLKSNIVQQLLEQILHERNHNPVNRKMLKNVIRMIIKIDLYKDLFEPEFFKITEVYYKKEASEMLKNFEICRYLDNTEERIKEELDRIEEYLDKSSENKLVALIERIFITENLQVILSNGFEFLMENHRLGNLKQLYYFLNKLNKLDFLKKTWQYYIKTKGTLLVNAEDVSVEKILEFKVILDKVMSECFAKNGLLRNALHYAFEDFINLKTNKIAELTSKHIDEKLKKAHKLNMNEDELEIKLDEVLSIFRFLLAKDVFEAFYTKRLVKRLLLGNISSFELEGRMVEKFKAECGVQYTKKAEDIFKDFEISKALNTEYLASGFNSGPKLGIDFSTNIFSTNSWPLKNNQIIKFPSPLKELADSFTQFYLKKYPGVQLFWQYETSTCDVIATYGQEKYTLTVSLVQAVLLIILNTHNDHEISYKELQQIMLGVEPEKLKGEVLSMVVGKDKLLNKTPDTPKFGDLDVVSVNETFNSKLKKIKINSLQKKETTEDLEQTTNRVLQERQYLLDAAIVRIMKGKKSIIHNDLVNEVFNDLKLPISIPEIKKRIESLIERDYMTRDKENHNVYHYVA
jgi:cullin-4